MSRNVSVAVWGSQGAGKTSFSASFAQTLSHRFHSILLANANAFQPAFSLWGVVPDANKAEKEDLKVESIGKILSVPDLTEEYLRHRVLYHPDNRNIGLIGYLTGDDCAAYEEIQGNAAQAFLAEAKRIFQVTVVDCCLPQYDKVTERALQNADVVILLIEPNSMGVAFLRAQAGFIRRNLSDGRRYIFLAAKTEASTAVEQFEYRLGVRFNSRLPYLSQIRYNLDCLHLFESYNGEYGETVDKMVKTIIEEASA